MKKNSSTNLSLGSVHMHMLIKKKLHERKEGKTKNTYGVKRSKNEWRAASKWLKMRGAGSVRIRERRVFTHYSTQLTAGEGEQFIPPLMALCVSLTQ